MWISLLEQDQISAALLLSQSVWEPKKLGEMLGAIEKRVLTFSSEKPEGGPCGEQWEAPSLARVLKHMPAAQRAAIEKSFAA